MIPSTFTGRYGMTKGSTYFVILHIDTNQSSTYPRVKL